MHPHARNRRAPARPGGAQNGANGLGAAKTAAGGGGGRKGLLSRMLPYLLVVLFLLGLQLLAVVFLGLPKALDGLLPEQVARAFTTMEPLRDTLTGSDSQTAALLAELGLRATCPSLHANAQSAVRRASTSECRQLIVDKACANQGRTGGFKGTKGRHCTLRRMCIKVHALTNSTCPTISMVSFSSWLQYARK